jgi:zinc transport system permease protein
MPAVYSYDFMIRAVIAASIVGVVLGALSHLVVLRKQAFLSAALGQAAMTGLSIGVLLGEPLDAAYGGPFGTCLLAALALVYLKRRTALSSDTLIGVFLALTLGVGVCLLVSVTKRFDVHQLEAVMFGSLLTVTTLDLVVLAVVGALALAIAALAYNAWIVEAVSPELARARQLPTAALEYALVCALTLAIVVSLEIVGALLVEALILVPAAAERGVARSLRSYLVVAVVVAVLGGQGGLYVSSVWSVPSGGAVVLVLSGLFFVALIGGALGRALVARRAGPAPLGSADGGHAHRPVSELRAPA